MPPEVSQFSSGDFTETYADAASMDQDERFQKLEAFVDKYEAEIEEYGADRLRVQET